jgi:hypothetical protein
VRVGEVKRSASVNPHARFMVFTVLKIQVEDFWVVTPCSFVVGYPEDGGSMIP